MTKGEMSLRDAVSKMDAIIGAVYDGDMGKQDAKAAVRKIYHDTVKDMEWEDRIETLWSEAMATIYDIEAA